MLATLGLAAGLAFGRAELVALAAPPAVVLAAGLAAAVAPRLTLAFAVAPERLMEGETAHATVTVSATRPVHRLEVAMAVPDGARAEADSAFSISLGPGEERQLPMPLAFSRWGAYVLGRGGLAAFDRLGLFVFEGEIDERVPVRVYPRQERLRRLVRPRETQPYVGNLVSRAKGEGIEFADLRPYQPGDRARSVNWRATARRGSLVVNEHHPERNAAVVLLLDSFAEARLGAAGTLDQGVRATASIAAAFLARRDQVGLLSFGGSVNWLEPALGTGQLYRITEALLDTEIVLSYVWRDIRVIPVRALPPQALVVGVTPLLDQRMIDALADVRGRGADVAVIEISPAGYVGAAPGEAAGLARRLWLLERAAVRSTFRRLGTAIVEWRPGDPLEPVLEEVTAFRRYARAMHV